MLAQVFDSIQYDEQNCPCCNQPVAIHGVQTYPARYNIPDKIMVHCLNPDCGLYMRTTTDLDEAYQNWLSEQNG